MNRIAAIVVTHNSEAEIGACLDSLRGCSSVVVIDNASSDDTLQAASKPWVRILASPRNLGFAAAVNQGVQATNEPLILVINPDAEILSGLSELAEAAEHHGLASSMLVNRDGSAQSGFTIRRLPTPATLIFEVLGWNRLWPGNPLNRRYRYADRDLDIAGPVEQPAGACLMMRREVFDSLGGFDESFFPVWFEDVDFAKRAHDGGYEFQYCPAAVVRHEGGHSVGRIPGECRKVYWYVSLLRYAAKHYRTPEFRTVSGAVVVGCLFRQVWELLKGNSAPGYRQVIRMAWMCLVSGHLRLEAIRTEPLNKINQNAEAPVASHPVER